VLSDDRALIGGDGFDYHFSALRLADGLGYTRFVGDVGAPAAHHPPGWTTLLGGVSWLGARSFRDHQLVGVVLGLVLVVLVAMIGRRYFSPRVGLIAAIFAAAYPGFWLLEGNVVSEPLALVLLALFFLLVADLRERPTMVRVATIGVVTGLLALVRPEQIILVLVVVVPLLLADRSEGLWTRVARIAVVGIATLVVVIPWAAYNTQRFGQPVALSTGDGGTLLAANCDPGSLKGEFLGFWDRTCSQQLTRAHPGVDEAEHNSLARDAAIDNLRANGARLPIVVLARAGRLLAVYRPTQTVDLVAQWMTVDSWLIWAWVGAFWIILPLALAGGVIAYRGGRWFWPLTVPFVVALVELLAFYGEPRYHTMADLGLIVLAAVAVDRLLPRGESDDARPAGRPARRPRRPSVGDRDRSRRLPSVHVRS
jgi:4-amino-4-deoxy-L-arabinose transferase-like glycosyltransferase